MIYTKEEVKSLLEKGTHVIYNDGSDGVRDIKCLELQVWNSILKEWVDYDGLHKFRLKPNRESELERLAEYLGYNLIKK